MRPLCACNQPRAQIDSRHRTAFIEPPQVFPLFQDASRFTTVTSVYGQGGIAAAMGSSMPTIAEPTAQGIISVLSFAVNVFVFAYILKRAKVQKKNPWKNEIFTDTKDYKEAMERA